MKSLEQRCIELLDTLLSDSMSMLSCGEKDSPDIMAVAKAAGISHARSLLYNVLLDYYRDQLTETNAAVDKSFTSLEHTLERKQSL